MSKTAVLVAIAAFAFPASVFPQGGEADRARADALRALRGSGDGRVSQDLERSRQQWPAYDREIEAGLVEQQKALDAGAKATEDLLIILQNRAKMQETPPALYLYGRLLGLVERVDDAASQFEAALRMDPYFPWAHHGLGTCCGVKKKFPEAVKAYKRAIELNPSFTRSMEPLAACLLTLDQGDEAERVLRKLVEIQPDDFQGWFSLARVLSQRVRYPEAVIAFRSALSKKPGQPEAERGLARALLAAGKPGEAAAVYQEILKREPQNIFAMLGLAKALEDQGENHAAADVYQMVLDNWTVTAPKKEDLITKIEELHRLPKTEKRDPRTKSPHEWVQILLNSTEPERSREAIRVLRECPGYDEEIYKAFLHALKNKDAQVRTLAVKELAERYRGMLSELTPLFAFFLEDKERMVRAMTASRLGLSDDPAAVPPLVKALKDRDPYVFRQVYDALWRLTVSDMSPKLPKELTPEAMDAAAKSWERWYADNRDRYKKYESAPK